MFNNGDQRKEEQVQMVLIDGRVIEGTLLLPMSSDTRRALNGDSHILEFVHTDGRVSVIAKQSIVEIVLLKETQAMQTEMQAAQQTPQAAVQQIDQPAEQPAPQPVAEEGPQQVVQQPVQALQAQVAQQMVPDAPQQVVQQPVQEATPQPVPQQVAAA